MTDPITLKVYRGRDLLSTRRFTRDIIKIGRLSSAHLCLDDPGVSGVHSVIEVAHDGAVSIIDMGSVQGTFVNGQRVSRSPLKAGDQITLGGLRIVLERGEVLEPAVCAVAPLASAPVVTCAPSSAPSKQLAHQPVRASARRRRIASTTQVAEAGDLGVELRMLWGETLLDAGVFVRPQHPVLAGLTKNCQFLMTGSSLPAKEFPILRFEEGEYQVLFARGMEGEVEEQGARTPLSQFMKGSLAATGTAIEGAYAVALPAAGAVRVEFGSGLSMEASLQHKPKPATLPWYQGINYRFLNVLLLLFFLMGGFVIVASNYAYDPDLLGDELSLNPWVKTNFVVPAVQPTPQVTPQGPRSQAEKAIPVLAARHSGEEGESGTKDGPAAVARRAFKGDPNDENPSNGSLVSLIGKGFRGLAPILSPFGRSGSLREAVGKLNGPLVGDSRGLESMGLKGHGPGGGNPNESISIGTIDTKTGTIGSDKIPMKLGNPKHPEPTIESDGPGPISNYDRDIVRKVVHDHAGQIRACYERQLLSSPQLEGKVVIRWQINPDGRVSDVRLLSDESTVGDRPLQQCIMNQIAAWEFPPPKGGGVALIRYPWLLRPSGGGT